MYFLHGMNTGSLLSVEIRSRSPIRISSCSSSYRISRDLISQIEIRKKCIKILLDKTIPYSSFNNLVHGHKVFQDKSSYMT